MTMLQESGASAAPIGWADLQELSAVGLSFVSCSWEDGPSRAWLVPLNVDKDNAGAVPAHLCAWQERQFPARGLIVSACH